MSCEIALINENNEIIKNILTTSKTIAIIGLSPDSDKDSHKVAKYLQEEGYKIIPIYPKGDIILNEKVYKSLSEIKDKIDIVNVFRKADALEEIVQDVLKRDDISTVWSQKGIVNNEAMQKAKQKGLNTIQNKCIMIEDKILKGKI